ncbi:TonB-dependent receptor, partial [Oleiagrimonas sp.]|uniref:TonB-dependent receptor family protein n=1 Tax=Oleiagrimonas sp. TaxID=2010330 RepID=UPI002638462A
MTLSTAWSRMHMMGQVTLALCMTLPCAARPASSHDEDTAPAPAHESTQDVASPARKRVALPGPATALPAVRINASRLDIDPFDVPAALSVAYIDPGRSGQSGVNLSEVLTGIPGILVRNRQDYAQDEQVSIRGYGARATFGVRGIRIYMDGIPATLPDGSGQVSAFNLDSADRVEVLRGPFSALYGNAAGGVIQVYTAGGTPTPQTTLGVYAGSYDSFRALANTRGTVGSVDYNIAASTYVSGGYRAHSRVHRESDNARFGIDLGGQRKLIVVLNRFYQPDTQDPQGLTRAQVTQDPRQASAVAALYNTRKSAEQNQVGLVYKQTFSAANAWRVMAYDGHRSIIQFLSIPPFVQANPLQAGAVVAPATHYGGGDVRWTHHGEIGATRYVFVLGASGEFQIQRRKGYENFIGGSLGVQGALRRNELDNANTVAGYAQLFWHLTPRWALLLGLRHDDVRFIEHDHYITAANPDDSGHVTYRANTPVVGLRYSPADHVRLYASFGRGFQTPTYGELGYRSDGQPGLAFDLKPARSDHYELGAKWRVNRVIELDAALFRSDTRDELAVASNSNGRATYRNAGRTRREGLELSASGELVPDWQLMAGYTHIRARFSEGYLTCTGAPCIVPDTPVAAGSSIPGVPRDYGSLRLAHGGDLGWRQGVTVTGVGPVVVNDVQADRAPGYMQVDADAGYTFTLDESTRLDLSARIDNLANRRYIGAVVVNDANGRY